VKGWRNFTTSRLTKGVDWTEEPSVENCKAANEAWDALTEEEQIKWEHK
jgi:hypothetical protein